MNQQPAGEYRLIISGGPDKGKAYRLVPPRVRVGRDLENDIVLSDPRVSRNHFVLEFIEGNLRVRDISKRGSLTINGKGTSEKILQNNDTMIVGGTKMKIQAVSLQSMALQVANQQGGMVNPAAQGGMQAQMGGQQNFGYQQQQRPPEQGGGKARFYIILGVVGLMFWLLMSDTTPIEEEEDYNIRTSEEMASIIEEAEKRNQEALQKRKFATPEAEIRYNTAEEHFTRGFRDYQKGQFARAMEAFQTALTSDRTHGPARRYYQLAKKRRDEVIDYHLREGQDYFERSMYRKCASSMLKAMIMINNRQENKFKQAESQKQECELLLEKK